MKKILFLILFLTGITPVFKNNTLHLVCYQSYGQEDPWGLEEVIICNEPDQITVDDYGSYTMTETCVWSNKYGIDTNDCEWNCSSVRSENEPPDDDNDDKPDCTGEIGGSAYLASCGCIGGSTGIESCDSDPDPGSGGSGNPCGSQVTCDSGYQLNYTTCNCECTRTCPTGYRLENCDCIQINTPPPPDPDPCAEAIRQAFNGLTQQGKLAEILSKFNGPNAKYKINISTGSLGGDADLARTSNSGTPRTYNIVFNENYPNATSLSKATSLIHEYIHAYFNTLYDDWKNNGNIHAYDEYPALKAFYIDRTYSSTYSKDAHHEAIANSFINLMAATIQEYSTGIPVVIGNANQFYVDMAWSSLQGTPAYNNSNLTEEAKDRIGSQRAVETYNEPRGIYTPVGTPCNN